MTNKIVVKGEFRWLTRDGTRYRPDEMATHHLFYTLRVLWNHLVPARYVILPLNSYAFGPEYTSEYLRDALFYLYEEAHARKVVSPRLQKQLAFMMNYIPEIEGVFEETEVQ